MKYINAVVTPALRVFRAETRLTVYRSCYIDNESFPRLVVILRDFFKIYEFDLYFREVLEKTSFEYVAKVSKIRKSIQLSH